MLRTVSNSGKICKIEMMLTLPAYRPPYYHRNGASELMGLIYGEYAGRSDEFQPGGVSYECGFVPHGVAYEEVRMS